MTPVKKSTQFYDRYLGSLTVCPGNLLVSIHIFQSEMDKIGFKSGSFERVGYLDGKLELMEELSL